MPQTLSQIATKTRIKALRQRMTKANVDAYWVPSADEHLNEYLPEHLKRREWLSGFDGSAGDCLVLSKTAWLFVDGRYHEQVESQVDLKQIQVSKLGQKGHKSLLETLEALAKRKKGLRIGYDPFTLTAYQYEVYEAKLKPYGVTWVAVSKNWVDQARNEIESIPEAVSQAEIYKLSDRVSGQSMIQKLKSIREAMKAWDAEILPLTKLDQIAWLFNLRGQDIPYNPVFVAYAIMTPKKAYLFIDSEASTRMKPAVKKALEKNVILKPYLAYGETLKELISKKQASGSSQASSVWVDKNHTTQGTVRLIRRAKGKIVSAPNPVEKAKAIKNPAEIRGMKEAHLSASVALVRAWKWLEDEQHEGSRVTEKSFADKLEAYYAEDTAFKGLSFNTIPGAGANGAIVHYGTPDAKKVLKKGELFLFDSGAQYLGKDWAGTTDTTRTVFIGASPTKKYRDRYTAVLKAHINCACLLFPQKTTGAALDSITRAPMWQEGLDFLHGTGHGVGAFLNVHEGPIGISSRCHTAFEPGMITSIEPGYYESGWGGIRLENLNLVVKRNIKLSTTGELMLGFDPLIFVPFDSQLINTNELTPDHLQWLKGYHQEIIQQLTPRLAPAEMAWLKTKCKV